MSETPANGLTLAEQRVAGCPLKPCRGADDNETELRSIRSGRLLCMYCATPTATGYMGREEARAHDDKFFKGTNRDYVVTGLLGVGLGIVVNAVMFILLEIMGGGFLIWFAAFILGSLAGRFAGDWMRRATDRRVGRYSSRLAAGAIVAGALLSPTVYFLIRYGLMVTVFDVFRAVGIPMLIVTGVLASTVYAAFQRRI